MNHSNEILIILREHFLHNFFLPSALIVRDNNHWVFMSHSSTKSLGNNYIRGGEITEDGISTIHKVSILIQDVHSSNMVNLLSIKILIVLICINILTMNTPFTCCFSLLDSLTESNSPLSLELIQDVLDDRKELYSLALA